MKDKRDILIKDMLATIEGLGYVPTARIDARLWAKFYQKQINKLNKPRKRKT